MCFEILVQRKMFKIFGHSEFKCILMSVTILSAHLEPVAGLLDSVRVHSCSGGGVLCGSTRQFKFECHTVSVSWISETCGKPSILPAPASDFLEQWVLRDAQPAKCNLPKYEPWGAMFRVTLGRGLFGLCGKKACLLTLWLSFFVNETKSMEQSPS